MSRLGSSCKALFWLCSLLVTSSLAVADAGARPGVAVVVVLDTSTSMQGEPIEHAATAASLVTAAADATFLVGLVTFDSTVRVVTEQLAPAAAEVRRALLKDLAAVRANGNTDLLGAVLAAARLLEKSDATEKWILFLTDGRQTISIPEVLIVKSGSPMSPTEQLVAAQEKLAGLLKGKNIRVMAIGLGKDIDRPLLENLAVTTGGLFLAVGDPAQLLETYVQWLRTVGRYYVATDREEVELSDGDTDVKMLMALSTAQFGGVRRDGTELDLQSAGFESWSAPTRRLWVLQSPRPAAGVYRLAFDRPRGTSDRVFLLKRDSQKWSARITCDSLNSLEPIRVEMLPVSPGRSGDKWVAKMFISDTGNSGASTIEKPLAAAPDGAFRGEAYTDPAALVQRPGVYNVRVRISDAKSGWTTERAQSVRVDPGPPRVLAELISPAGLKVVQRGSGSEVELGPLVPLKPIRLELRLRSTSEARGRTLVFKPRGGDSGAIAVSGPSEIHLSGGPQTVPLEVQVPTLLTRDSTVALALAFKDGQGDGALLNGSPGPIEFCMRAGANVVDLRVAVKKPEQALTIRCGHDGMIPWTLEFTGDEVPAAEVTAELIWDRESPSPSPAVSLSERDPGVRARRLPLTKSTTIPIAIHVPREVPAGAFQPMLSLAVQGTTAVYTLNGQRTLRLPLTFRTELAELRLQVLDESGKPLENGICRHQILSPVTPHQVKLQFTLTGEGPPPDLTLRPTELTAQDVHARLERSSPHETGQPRIITATLDVPAQAPPGVRRLAFELDPGPGMRLVSGDHLTIELEVPEAVLQFLPESGPDSENQIRLAYGDWLRWLFVGRPVTWQGRIGVCGKTAGLSNAAACRLSGASWDLGEDLAVAAADSPADGAKQRWSVAVSSSAIPGDGDYAVRGTLDCPYRHLKVLDIEGNPIQPFTSGSNVTVGLLRVQRPDLRPVVAALAALVIVGIAFRAYRRPVPGGLLVQGAERDAASGDRRYVSLGGYSPRVLLDRQELKIVRRGKNVWIRWVRGDASDSVTIHCPSGHDRLLRLGGGRERLCADDEISTGPQTAKYIADVERHCLVIQSASDTLSSLDNVGDLKLPGEFFTDPASYSSPVMGHSIEGEL